MLTRRTFITAKDSPNPMNHQSGVPFWRTRLLIFSVTLAKSWRGASNACISGWGTCTVGCSPRIAEVTSRAMGGCSGAGGSGCSGRVPASLARRPGQLRVRVLDLGQVGRARARVQLTQQRVVAVLRLQLRDRAARVVDVAEHDGLRGAHGLAGGLDLAVADAAPFVVGGDARLLDALHAVRALLHDPAAAHAHVGVALQLDGRRVPVLIEQEVEAPHLVGAVVRAVAGADAAVVDLVVQALVAVHGGGHRADLLARRVLALHARQGLEVGPDRLRMLGGP